MGAKTGQQPIPSFPSQASAMGCVHWAILRRAEVTRRPANDEMVQGYMDGRGTGCPEPSGNRSNSYCHGFKVGRAEREGKHLGTFDQVTRWADEAMDADTAIMRA